MLFGKDKDEIRKVVMYYSMYSSVYFSLLLISLFLTDWIYFVGKYKFISVILFIVLAEVGKYLSSAVYIKSHDINLGKKYSEKTPGIILRNLFIKAKIKEGLKNVSLIVIMAIFYFVISILYGADFFGKYEETLMFSSLLAVLTIFPACVNLGSESVISLIMGSKPIHKLEVLLYQNLCLTIMGAWLGAFVIPLDWDRPWQVWPIPCCFGAMIGFLLSHLVAIVQVNSSHRKKTTKPFLFQK